MAGPHFRWLELVIRLGSRVRTLLIQLLTVSALTLHEVESVVGLDDKNTVIKATVSATERNDAQVEQVTSRLSLERDVVGVSWQALSSTSTELRRTLISLINGAPAD
jgi:hypothetical protein